MSMEFVDMIPTTPSRQLVRTTEADVDAWFRAAWPGRKDYPNEVRNWAVATRINVIVDRANARSENDPAAAALMERTIHYREALKSARALQRKMQLIKSDLLSLKEMLRGPRGIEPAFLPLAEEMAAIEKIERATDEFLSRCEPPKGHDHQDEISWIADAAQKAWARTPADIPKDQEKRVPFGLGPEGPLASFVQLVSEGIGLTSEDRPGNSRERISDHLRGRQNRKRNRKKDKK
jgi:hypothetical protein